MASRPTLPHGATERAGTMSEPNAESVRPFWQGVKVASGGWMRFEDYCDSGPRGSCLRYTSGIVTADEELFGIECGWRVANAVITKAVDGWDALLDACLAAEARP